MINDDICIIKNTMKIISIIPARYESKRFPGKLLETIGDESVIEKTYNSVLNTSLFEKVFVATDSLSIKEKILSIAGDVIFTEKNHICGSDRVAEASINLEADIIVNVQADEPFIDKKSLSDLIKIYKDDKKELIGMASLMSPIKKSNMINNPNIVKVVVDNNNFALYFSRAKIPFNRDEDNGVNYFRHIGVYGFRRKSLIEFSNNGETPLEKSEKIECIRQLEMGRKIKMVKTNISSFSIDEFSDLLKAKKLLN